MTAQIMLGKKMGAELLSAVGLSTIRIDGVLWHNVVHGCVYGCVCFLGLIELNSQQVCLIDHASASSSV